jgi:hypothetical protein
MFMEENKIGEETTETPLATDEPVIAQEDDSVLAEFAKIEADNIKLQEERDNYRKAYLKKAKGEAEEPDFEDESEDERIRRIFREEQFNSKEAENQRKKDELNQKIIKENEELRKALANRSQINSSSQGSNMDKPEVKGNSMFSPDQEAELRARAAKLNINPEEYLAEVAGNLGNPFGLKDIPTKRT